MYSDLDMAKSRFTRRKLLAAAAPLAAAPVVVRYATDAAAADSGHGMHEPRRRQRTPASGTPR